MFLEISLMAVFIDVITEVDISENCVSLFIAICRSNISAMLIALFLERMIAIFDLAIAVRSLISETNALNCMPNWLCDSQPPEATDKLLHGSAIGGYGVPIGTSNTITSFNFILPRDTAVTRLLSAPLEHCCREDHFRGCPCWEARPRTTAKA
jgi:hypothetical protein